MTPDLLVTAAGSWQESWDWAWQRHTNEISWYIRPLFLVPMAWAAYRRSAWGIAISLLALVTSMAWFPAPAVPDAQVLAFVEFEQDWLTDDWTAGKVALSSLVPLSLGAYCAAFWQRSLGWGLVVLNGMALGKILWAVVNEDGGVAVVVPALVGLAIGDAAVLAARNRSLRRRRPRRPESAAAHAVH